MASLVVLCVGFAITTPLRAPRAGPEASAADRRVSQQSCDLAIQKDQNDGEDQGRRNGETYTQHTSDAISRSSPGRGIACSNRRHATTMTMDTTDTVAA